MAKRKVFEAVINAAQELRKLGGTQAERMARAAEQGYDTSRVLYHGSTQDVGEFASSRGGEIGPGVYVTHDPAQAAEYAKHQYGSDFPQGANITPVFAKGKLKQMDRKDWVNRRAQIMDEVRSENAGEWNAWMFDEAQKRLNQEIVSDGYTGVYFNNPANTPSMMYDQGVIFDAAQIRSVNADFNPEYRDSPNLLAGIAGAMPYAGATAALLAGATPQEAEAGTMSAAAKAYAKYMSKRTWKSADEATAYLREKIAKDNAAGWGRPVDPAIVDEFNFVKHGKDVKISQRGIAGKRKPVGFTLEQDGAAMVGDWGKKDLNDYTEGFADQLRGYVDLDSIPQEKLAGGYNAYGWEELSRGGEIPPITLKANKNGSLSILDGNHRLRFARDRGDDQIPATIVGEVKGLTPRERGSVNPLLLAGTATLAGTGMALNSREAEAGPLQTLGRAAPYLTSAALGGAAALQSNDAEAGTEWMNGKEPISIMPPTYNDTMQRTQAAINKIDQFKAKRAGKRGAMDQMKLELQTLLKGASLIANDVLLPELDKAEGPLRMALGFGGVFDALARGKPVENSWNEFSRVMRQPADQSADDVGGVVTDNLSPYVPHTVAAGAGALTKAAILMNPAGF